MRFQFRTQVMELDPVEAHKDIVVLQVDEISIREFGRWPWDRNIHGDLLQLLQLQPPKVVTYDFIFSESSPNLEHDATFSEGMFFT